VSKSKLLVPQSKPTNDVGAWMATLRESLFDAVTAGDVADIGKKLVEKAKAGDLKATDMLFKYILGDGAMKIKNAVVMQQAPSPPPSAPSIDPRAAELFHRIRRGEIKLMEHAGDGVWKRLDASEIVDE